MKDSPTCIASLALLGDFLRQFEHTESVKGGSRDLDHLNRLHYDAFEKAIENEHIYNAWFTPESIRRALGGIALMLVKKDLLTWLEPYQLADLPYEKEKAKTVGLVLAGNIPLVGFHDVMSVLAAGHNVLAKPSSKDEHLVRKLAELLEDIDPHMKGRIRFTDDRLEGMDAVIATGSNNSARYFEQYFKHIPHIIRKNRNGVAVLTGKESREELLGLGEDIFSYFGMGCRNVTKLFVPKEYDLSRLLSVLDDFISIIQHHKYSNNVDYHRSIYMMNLVPLLDNGALLLKEDAGIASPVGVVFYERYSEIAEVQSLLELKKEEIQCVISAHPEIREALRPGSSQSPAAWDYADGVDTISFLKKL